MGDRAFWFQRIIWIFDRRAPATIIAAGVLAISLIGQVWTLMAASGVRGSLPLALGLVASATLSAALVLALAGPLHWYLLLRAVKSYVRRFLLRELTTDKILVGIGPGGALAVGVVAKAIRDLGFTPPSVLIFDMRYEVRGHNPTIGSLWPEGWEPDASRCWIIQGNVSGGRSLEELRRRFSLHDCPVFAFVVSEQAPVREKIDHYMAVGSRSAIPWATERPAG